MRQVNFPHWLLWVDKNLKWMSIPKLPLILTVLQVLGFLLVMGKPDFADKLVLYPKAVLAGDFWRMFTFIAIPLMGNALVFLLLWFLYDVMVWLEEAWGSTLLTVYFLSAWVTTVLASLLIGIPIGTFAYTECSFFFALATLAPNREMHIFFILPVPFKYIAVFIAAVMVIVPLFLQSSVQLIFLTLLFANYLLFFGKDCWLLLKRELKKRRKQS